MAVVVYRPINIELRLCLVLSGRIKDMVTEEVREREREIITVRHCLTVLGNANEGKYQRRQSRLFACRVTNTQVCTLTHKWLTCRFL